MRFGELGRTNKLLFKIKTLKMKKLNKNRN